MSFHYRCLIYKESHGFPPRYRAHSPSVAIISLLFSVLGSCAFSVSRCSSCPDYNKLCFCMVCCCSSKSILKKPDSGLIFCMEDQNFQYRQCTACAVFNIAFTTGCVSKILSSTSSYAQMA